MEKPEKTMTMIAGEAKQDVRFRVGPLTRATYVKAEVKCRRCDFAPTCSDVEPHKTAMKIAKEHMIETGHTVVVNKITLKREYVRANPMAFEAEDANL